MKDKAVDKKDDEGEEEGILYIGILTSHSRRASDQTTGPREKAEPQSTRRRSTKYVVTLHGFHDVILKRTERAIEEQVER